MIIRRLEPVDFDALKAVDKLTVAAYIHSGLIAAESDYALELRSAAQRAREAKLLIASDTTCIGDTDEAVLGTVTYCSGGTRWAEIAGTGEAGIRMLAVAEAARGRGVGQALVQACIDQAREDEVKMIRLSTKSEMRAAQRIYARVGFYRTPDLDWSPAPNVALLTYALELD